MQMTSWIYLSPHPDDVALSCGGLVWQQAQAGEAVSIWTICAGDPPPGALSPFAALLHARWQTGPEAMAARRQEDIQSCQRLGARALHFDLPDCIYRQVNGTWPYASEEGIFSPLAAGEASLPRQLAAQMATRLPPGAELVSPLALGDHVDHRLARLAAEALGRPLHYYADYPYAARPLQQAQVAGLEAAGWHAEVFPLTLQAQRAWEDAVAEHASQISTFWPAEAEMRQALAAYAESMGGTRLWRAPSG